MYTHSSSTRRKRGFSSGVIEWRDTKAELKTLSSSCAKDTLSSKVGKKVSILAARQ